MRNEDVAYLSATELVEAYETRELSPVEVTRVALERIEELQPRLNCFCVIDADAARRAARASETRWRDGEPLGPVDGVPATVKDLIQARGWPTLRGSRTVDPAGPWEIDAPSTARLRESGAVLLGKTTTPEFGWRGSTDSPLTGITRNPWNTELTPGGSSGGAVAALAAGLGALALGTDGGGSVRIPAAFTGTVGLKPHFGRIPAYPLSPMGTLSHIGTQTRTVADCALMMRVVAQPDPRDSLALPAHAHDWSHDVRVGAREHGIRGLRIAYSPRLGYVRYVDPRIEAAVREVARCFESLGAIVEEVDPPLPDSAHAFRAHWCTHARHLLHRLPPEKFELLDPGLQQVVDEAKRYTLADYLDAQLLRGTMGTAMGEFHQAHDLLLTPATAVPPFPVGLVMPPPPEGVRFDDAQDWTWWAPFSFPFNMTQQPALVMGCGFTDDGLPLAMQLVAPAHREDLCLRAASAYETATEWHRRRPPI